MANLWCMGYLVSEGLSSASLANPLHIPLSHQHPQGLADVWSVAKLLPTTGHRKLMGHPLSAVKPIVKPIFQYP